MGARGDDLAAVDDGDAIGPPRGREPVGDDDHGFLAEAALQALLNDGLGGGVEGARRLVKEENGRAADQSPSNRDPLPLARRHPDAALADRLVVALWPRGDKVVGAGLAGRSLDLGAGRVGTAVADVVDKGAAEKKDVLGNDGERGAEALEGDGGELLAIDADAAGIDIVVAEEEGENGRFARSARADEGEGLARGDGEGDAAEGRARAPGGVVGEVDLGKFDAPAAGDQRGGARGIADVRAAIENRQDPGAGAAELAETAVERAEGADGAGDGEGVEEKGCQLARAEGAGDDFAAALPEDQREGAKTDELEGAEKHADDPRLARLRPTEVGKSPAIALALALLLMVGVNGADAAEGLFGAAGESRQMVLDAAAEALEAAAEDGRDKDNGRDDDQREKRELEAHREEDGDCSDEGNHRPQTVGDAHGKGCLNDGEVAADAREKFADPLALEVSWCLRDETREGREAKVAEEARAGDPEKDRLKKGEGAADREKTDEGERDPVELVEVGLDESRVDDPAGDSWRGEEDGALADEEDAREEERPEVGADDLEEPMAGHSWRSGRAHTRPTVARRRAAAKGPRPNRASRAGGGGPRVWYRPDLMGTPPAPESGASAPGDGAIFWRHLGTAPNLLSLSRIVAVLAAAMLYLYGHRRVALPLGFAAGITDLLDGYLARRLNQTTELGAILDRLSDLVLESTALVCAMHFTLVPPWFLVLYLTREFVVLSARLYLAEKGIALQSTFFGRLKTDFLCFGVLFLFAEHAGFASGAAGRWSYQLGLFGVAAGLLLSYLSGAMYLRSFVRRYRAA